VQTPGGAESRNTAANNHDTVPLYPTTCKEGTAIAKSVAQLERIVDEATGDRTVTLDGKPDQSCAAGFEKLPARDSQWLMSFQS
jgi:hypothetical protein